MSNVTVYFCISKDPYHLSLKTVSVYLVSVMYILMFDHMKFNSLKF